MLLAMVVRLTSLTAYVAPSSVVVHLVEVLESGVKVNIVNVIPYQIYTH